MSRIEKIVLVTRRTRLEELLIRFGTRDQARFYLEHMQVSFDGYDREHAVYTAALETVRRTLPGGLRLQVHAPVGEGAHNRGAGRQDHIGVDVHHG